MVMSSNVVAMDELGALLGSVCQSDVKIDVGRCGLWQDDPAHSHSLSQMWG